MFVVTCNRFRESISARVDGELTAEASAELDAHLATCPSCRAFEQESYALRRALRVTAADEPSSIEVRALPSLRTATALQYVLFVIGATLIALNAGAVVSPDAGLEAHLGRHDGVFGTALGIGMVAVAFKPQRAIGLVPLTSTLAVLMAVAAVADLVGDRTTALHEAVHVVELVGLICLWVISGGPARLSARSESVGAVLRRSTVRTWPTS